MVAMQGGELTEENGQMLSIDSYSELLCEPDWRTNLRGNGHLTENPEIYIEEYQPEQECFQSRGDRQGREINGGYRYIIDTGPVVVEMPHTAASELDQPYHLHPQDTPISSVASLSRHKNYLPHRSPHAELSRSSSFSTVNESDSTSQRRLRERRKNGFDNDDENISTSPRLTQDVHALEYQSCYQQELGHTQQGPSKTQKMSKSTLTSPQVLWDKKFQSATKDIVEHNKITLGRNTSKYGSYVRVHAFKQEMSHKGNKEAVSTENQEDSSGRGMRWLQKPQQLQGGQYSAPVLGPPLWSHAPKIQLALTPGNKQTDSEKPSCMSPERLNEQLHQKNLKSSTEHCQRTGVLKLPLSCDGESQILSPNEVHIKQDPQNVLRTPTAAFSQALGSHTVLPPIRKPPTGKEHELSPGQHVNIAHPIHRIGFDSYLCQMEKQKQMREKLTDKKMKRQKLYSNAICGQNNKISRISSLLAKDPEGNDKNVPRTKALEYAKTIPKPCVQSQPKQKQKQPPESFPEHAPYLQGLNASQLSALKLLRKRHEEEKQAVAHFRKVHAV